MKGSGLEHLFEYVYPANTVGHINIMYGKQVARAFRAHIMAQSALTTLLLNEMNETDLDFVKSHCVTKRLNLFDATGHSNYAKCARFYLQEMKELPNTHPWLYAKFINVMRHVKRSNKHCNSLSTDLAIEQSLMRSVKSRGGLSQGREYGEGVHHLWALSAIIYAQVHVHI